MSEDKNEKYFEPTIACVECGAFYSEHSGAVEGFTCSDCKDESIDIDWDEEDTEFPEYYQGISLFNPKIGIIEKPSVFKDTAASYGNILKKHIDVELELNSKEEEHIYNYKKGFNIEIPANGTKLIKEEGQLLEWYLKRPIFRLLAKSDDRNKQPIYDKLHSDGVITNQNWRGTDRLLDTVYNLVEYYRCENQQGRIFIGSKQEIDDVYSRIPDKVATNQIETLINTRCGRDDLIPEEFEEDARFYKNELRKVEGASATGTMIATRNIVTRIVQKTIQEQEQEPEPEPQPQPQPKGEQGQGQLQQPQGTGGFPAPKQEQEESDEQEESEQEQEDSSDNYDSQANSFACKVCGSICKVCGSIEPEESGAYEGFTCEVCYEGSEQEKQDLKDEQEPPREDYSETQEEDLDKSQEQEQESENLQDNWDKLQERLQQKEAEQNSKQGQKTEAQKSTDLKKEIDDAIEGKDSLGLERSTSTWSNEKLQSTKAKIDWDKTEQQILDKAKKEGEKQISDVKKIFEKIALEQKEKILKQLQATETVDFNSSILDGEKELSSDKALVSKLAETFARIKTRRVFNTADSGIRVNIDNYIRRYAGDDKVKLFEKHDLDSGLDIAYVIDCSQSMEYYLIGEYIDQKIDQAKKLLLTMVEATKNLKNVNNTIFAYGYGNCDRADIVKYSDIKKLDAVGSTPSHIGLYQAMRYLKKKSNRNRKLIIHITDGEPNDKALTAFTVNQIKQQGIEIHTILVTNESGSEKNKQYTQTYGGKDNFTQIADFNKVRQIVSTTVAKRIFEILA